MFVIRLLNGQEVHATEGAQLSVNHDTGVVTVTRSEGFEEVTMHYSPLAWETVMYRVRVRPSAVSAAR